MPFDFSKLDLPGVILVTPRVFPDARGFFLESYHDLDFAAGGIRESFVQDNHSRSSRGVLRGLHFQVAPAQQGKLVRVVHGRVWDVAVDMRRSSPHFLEWVSVEMSDEDFRMLYVPPGFAHGFVTLSETADLVYKCTGRYKPECDAGVRWDDPDIDVEWPISDVLLSEKDKNLPYLEDAILFD